MMKSFLFFSLSLFAVVCFAEGPDLKNLKYTAQKINSGAGFGLSFKAPADHHFNLEAPSKVDRLQASQTEAAELSKASTEIKASWKTTQSNCEITAQLYLCDNKNTYCLPVKQKFKCDGMSAEAQTGIVQNAVVTNSIEKSLKKDSSWESLFLKNDFNKALDLAKAQKKMILIDFFGIWCPPCNMLDATVFSTKNFKNFQKNYVFLKMDADDPVSFELKSKYNIKGYPTIILANSDAEEVSRIIGSRKPSAFFASLNQALGLRGKSLAQRKAQAETGKNPKAALEMAEMMSNQEDFLSAQKYFQLAQKSGTLNESQKQMMIDSQIKILSEASKDAAAQRSLVTFIENSLSVYPIGETSLGWTELLQKLGEDLKDESISNRAQNSRLNNVHELFKNPALLKKSELGDADLHFILAEIYGDLKDETKSKEQYQLAADSYEKQIKSYGLNIDTDRGFNLERIYCLDKAGQTEKAMALYQKLQALYPADFTFYYAHASRLNEAKKKDEALPLARKALEFSYGDNMLRATYLTADLLSQKSEKKEAMALIDKALSDYPKTDSLRVRSSRYLDRLKVLREKIVKM